MMRGNSQNRDTISIWIVEDDREYRRTLAYLLDSVSDMQCAEIFYAYEEVQAKVESAEPWTPPGVVLMDIHLPGISGIDGVSHLKQRLPGVPIVMLTHFDGADVIFRALCAGASGYLLKDTPLDETVAAVRAAYHGGTFMPAPVARKVLHFFTQQQPASDYGLTAREKEILRLMGEGLLQKQIAEVLFLSPYTVNNHIRHIYQKLHVNSGIEAVSKAFREKLI